MSRTQRTKKTETRTAETMAKLEMESAKHLMMRVLSSLPLSPPLSAIEDVAFAYQNGDKMDHSRVGTRRR